ncbi:hypothetical protein J3T65_01120 [Staphylococcus simiae]|uniref:hypothetical protein n=1 Tax=Staphylococcus simiae TaxID=308354 RepID=UPI001A961095|nr:hypothetical protein [Staphylococcus simiae]MBO1198148.1 hypothetical protein [Staphylococcus simiae]MBO1200308.1 hypothetical protein [Staphylococcus simiae]MBO1202528.1 hypothetical protein [Staphylococcus simiae]MBO1210194.1 hypothetical protein [Staphylococcus simiae]MBO1228672.1 hypothetical protein [Staphylococcus simiae]
MRMHHSSKIAIGIYLATIFISFSVYLSIILITSMSGHDVSQIVLDSKQQHHTSMHQDHLSLPKISFD